MFEMESEFMVVLHIFEKGVGGRGGSTICGLLSTAANPSTERTNDLLCDFLVMFSILVWRPSDIHFRV